MPLVDQIECIYELCQTCPVIVRGESPAGCYIFREHRGVSYENATCLGDTLEAGSDLYTTAESEAASLKQKSLLKFIMHLYFTAVANRYSADKFGRARKRLFALRCMAGYLHVANSVHGYAYILAASKVV